jgi:GH25 family lysozyme M1 (1,4-beta-N-acetylmuramidase)
MTDLHIPDTSEFQVSVDFRVLAEAGYGATILRAHTGSRADHTFAARLGEARKQETVRLFYGYCIVDRDPATQAREMAALVGPLQPGEAFVCDYEVSGGGADAARATAYLEALAGRDVLYSGDSFYHDHLTGVHTKGLLFWDAAYSSAEPSTPHFLWQHSDHETFPGISSACDASIYHGTVADLKTLLSGTPAPARKTPSQVAFPLPAGEVFHENVKHKALGTVYPYFNMPTPKDFLFTAELKAKIEEFQETHGLKVKSLGVIDSTTWSAMK